MADANTIATTAAMLCGEAHFVQSSPKLRPAYYGVPSAEQIASDVSALHRIAAAAKRRAEQACNGIERYNAKLGRYMAEWTDADEAAKERADTKALRAAQEIADRYGAKVKLGGDPRGFVLRLELSSGRRNSIGDGWGIA